MHFLSESLWSKIGGEIKKVHVISGERPMTSVSHRVLIFLLDLQNHTELHTQCM